MWFLNYQVFMKMLKIKRAKCRTHIQLALLIRFLVAFKIIPTIKNLTNVVHGLQDYSKILEVNSSQDPLKKLSLWNERETKHFFKTMLRQYVEQDFISMMKQKKIHFLKMIFIYDVEENIHIYGLSLFMNIIYQIKLRKIRFKIKSTVNKYLRPQCFLDLIEYYKTILYTFLSLELRNNSLFQDVSTRFQCNPYKNLKIQCQTIFAFMVYYL